MGKYRRSIEVDADVWRLLQSEAVPFEEEPNDVLRRLLGLDKRDAVRSAKKVSRQKRRRASQLIIGRQRPVKLDELIDAGLLKQGQRLYLCDESGNLIGGHQAKVSGDRLYSGGRFASMSRLAQELLGKAGHRRKAVRRPKHWKTADGTRVVDLWERYLWDHSDGG